MNILKRITVTILAFSFVVSCTGDFEDINTDPNKISEVGPATLMNPSIYWLASNNATRGRAITFLLMQVHTPDNSDPLSVDKYWIVNTLGTYTWNSCYRWVQDFVEMEQVSEEYGENNYVAIAKTMQAMIYANLVDMFGPISYSQSGRAEEGIIYPTFDSVESIYADLLNELNVANSLYNTEESLTYGDDIIYNNDIAKWQKFTNSLHLRLLLRISNVDNTAMEKIKYILSNPDEYPIFDKLDDSAILHVTGINPLISPWPNSLNFSVNRKMSKFFIDNLNDWDDPRRDVWANTPPSGSGVFTGIPGGGNPADYVMDEISNPDKTQVEAPMDVVFMDYAEVLFIKAELVQRGIISGDAQALYEAACSAAIERVTGSAPGSSYFSNTEVAFDNTLEKIYLQKYYALYFVDYQQWYEYRRTGYPKLPTTDLMYNNKVMPSRLLYPYDVGVSNQPGYQSGVEMLELGDDINSKLWWDITDDIINN